MTTLQLAFMTIISGMPLPPECVNIPPPILLIRDLSGYNDNLSGQQIGVTHGFYPGAGNAIYLDERNPDDRPFMQHESMHYIQWKCHMPQNEEEALTAQYL